jgi:hypothetical protein
VYKEDRRKSTHEKEIRDSFHELTEALEDKEPESIESDMEERTIKNVVSSKGKFASFLQARNISKKSF